MDQRGSFATLASLVFVSLSALACGAPTSMPVTELSTITTPTPTQPLAPSVTPVALAATAVPPTATPPPEQRLRVARTLADAKDFVGALLVLDALKRSDSSTPGLHDLSNDVHLTYAKTLLEVGDFDGSYAQYGEALKAWPDNPDARDGQKRVVLTKNWARMETAWDRDLPGAITAAEEIMRLDPNFHDDQVREKLYALLVRDADRLIAAKDRGAALPVLLRALELLPDSLEARVRLAFVIVCPDPESKYVLGYAALMKYPSISPIAEGAPIRAYCGKAYIVGRLEQPGLGLFDIRTNPPSRPTQFWYYVRTTDDPKVEGWTRASSPFQQLGARGDVTRLPIVPMPPQHPDGLPDLAFGDTRPTIEAGHMCVQLGPVPSNQWAVRIRNNGPASGPRMFELLIRIPGQVDRTITYELIRGLEPGEEYEIGTVPDHSQVILDPGEHIGESNKNNNTLRIGTGPTLTCVRR